MAKPKKNAAKILVYGVWRTCFLHVFNPAEDLNEKLKYSLDVLIPKDKPGDLLKMKKEYTNMCTAVFGSPQATNRPWSFKAKAKGDKAIVKDGDARYENADPDKREIYEPYKGHFYISLSVDPADGKPVVTDRNNVPIADESELQSGDYILVQFRMSAYVSEKWGQQVSLRLIGVRKIKTGERLTNSLINTEEALAGFESAEWDEDEWMEDDDDNWDDNDDVPF